MRFDERGDWTMQIATTLGGENKTIKQVGSITSVRMIHMQWNSLRRHTDYAHKEWGLMHVTEEQNVPRHTCKQQRAREWFPVCNLVGEEAVRHSKKFLNATAESRRWTRVSAGYSNSNRRRKRFSGDERTSGVGTTPLFAINQTAGVCDRHLGHTYYVFLTSKSLDSALANRQINVNGVEIGEDRARVESTTR